MTLQSFRAAPAVLLLSCTSILGACAGAVRPVAARVEQASSASSCTVREVSRQGLSAGDGRELYVEPVALAASRQGTLLIAGTPNYLWRRAGDGSLAAVARDSIFGTVVDAGGRARIVPSPIDPRLLSGIRAVARDDGTWSVLFAELKPGTRFPETEIAARLWHGILDGARWSHLEQLPLPASGELRSFSPSSAVQRGDTLAWALPLGASPGSLTADVAFFTRRNGEWAHEVVPTRRMAYIDLAHSATLGFVLAVAQPDREAGQASAIFLWARSPTWRALRRVVPGTGEHLHHPSLALSPGAGALGWIAQVTDSSTMRWEARAMAGDLERTGGETLLVDSAVTGHMVQVSTPGTPPVWIAEHVTRGSPLYELRFSVRAGDGVEVAGRLPSPFKGPFAAAWTAASDLVVAGPQFNEADQTLRTLLLRARLDCPPGAP